MAKLKKLFRKAKRAVSKVVGKRPKDQGGDMPLAPVLASVGRVAARAVPALIRAGRAAAPAISAGFTQAVAAGGFGFRRRRKSSLSVSEMGKITFLAQTLGKRNPAVTLIVMKALGGKL